MDKDKWDSLLLDTLVGTPWSPKGLGDQDQEVPAHIRELPDAEEGPAAPDFEPQIRRVYPKKADFERHGYTGGCPGCRFLQTGVGAQANHSQVCRARMERALGDTAEGATRLQRAHDRQTAIMAERVEKSDRAKSSTVGGGDEPTEGERARGEAAERLAASQQAEADTCLLYTSPSPRDRG